MPATVVVFARSPVKGEVKTRLAQTVGKEAATSFYKTCASLVLAECASLPEAVKVVVYHPEAQQASMMRRWLDEIGCPFELKPQSQSTCLGHRMYQAMKAEEDLGATKVLIVGTDVPDLKSEVLTTATELLDTFDVVLGPSKDGGYYLLGLRGVPDGLFLDIPWSTSQVLRDTLQAAARLSLRVAPIDAIPTLLDIDDIDDLVDWYCHLPDQRGPASPSPLQSVIAGIMRGLRGQIE